MSGTFITNQQEFLSEVINNILPTTEKAFFLIGYFYFSGYEELYKSLEDKQIRILVGLDVEKDISNKIREFEYLESINYSRGKIRDLYNQSLVQLFNDTDFFDTKEKENAFRSFLLKIKDGTLEIKKTVEPNHAKLYLFEKKIESNEGGHYPGVLITGSSNLSVTGLKNRFEINVAMRDKDSYLEGKKLFDELWANSIDIVTKDNMDDFFNTVIERIWLDKLNNPFILYIRVLVELFTLDSKDDIRLPAEITDSGYINLKYQTDAIKQALTIIKRHGGVILSDVVGLGKSIIASAIAHNLRLKTVVIAPPHLKNQWEDFHYDFDFNAKIFTSGKIEDALLQKVNNEEMLIIIDEAHKYRNEFTTDYASLHKLCQGNKVLLLTATPFNNRPEDIFSMIRLFQIPAKSTIQTVDNLALRFRELILEYRDIQKERRKKKNIDDLKERIKAVGDQIRNILMPIIIRRSRLDLDAITEYKEDLKRQNITFPKVNDPKLLDYELGDLTEIYEETLERICPEIENSGFVGARYKPTEYLKDKEKYKEKIKEEFGDENLFFQSQRNLALFMKRLLVRRFESSVDAFRNTVESMIASSAKIKDWYYVTGHVPIYKKGNLPDIASLLDSSEEEINESINEFNFEDDLDSPLNKKLEKYFKKGLHFIKKDELSNSFIETVESDIKLLSEIKKMWFENNTAKEDPKLKSLVNEIKQRKAENPERKIIIFSEFADTARYLYDRLKDDFKIFLYTSKEATETAKNTIKANFDAGALKKSNDYEILVATDAISEGYNLHRAGVIFNYDIPFNPTRVIQRVGRINRINIKVYDILYIYNFFPTATGERETGTKAISTLKISMIHSLLGEDTKILTPDEEPTTFYPETFEKLNKEYNNKFKNDLEDTEISWDVKHRNLYFDLKSHQPEVIQAALEVPKRSRIRRSVKKAKTGVVVFGKKGEEYAFKLGTDKNTTISISPGEALELFKAEISEKPQKVSDEFEKIYQNVKTNLFIRKSEIPKEKGKQKSIETIDYLIGILPEKKDYLHDLKKVIMDFDGLPEKYLKDIRAISAKTPAEDLIVFEKSVPHNYLVEILEKARRIDEGVETLILSEELV